MGEALLALPDVDVLVAPTNPSHVFHGEAHRWSATVQRYATTPVTESGGLLRMLLNPAVTGRDVPTALALEFLKGIGTDRRAQFLADDSSLTDAQVATEGLAGHRQVTDWHLLNLAARHGGFLASFDHKLVRAVSPTHSAW
jgi:uncharacterized protein